MGFSDQQRYQEQYIQSMKGFAEEATYLGVPAERLEGELAVAISDGRHRAEAQAREDRNAHHTNR